MPELPEVETVRRGMEMRILGQTIRAVCCGELGLRMPFPKTLKADLEGQAITRILRRAKYILVHLQSGKVMILHLGMSGRVRIHSRNSGVAKGKHDHLVMDFENGARFVFTDPRRFGVVLLAENESAAHAHASLKDIGPEPLEDAFTGNVLAARLKGKKVPIKTALLDQRLVAGVGNIYACEALFESGIAPLRLCESIRPKEAARLAEAIRSVLKRALDSGGSSLRDYRNTDGETGYFQHLFSVYDREGQPCPGCTCDVKKTGGIARIVQGGRSTFFCPRKQK